MVNRHKTRRVLKRDQRLCGIHFGGCGKRIEKSEQYNLDHIIPRALFSKVAPECNAEFNEDWNYQPMHFACNSAKASQLRGWPRFDCDCHYLQIHGRHLYAHTKGHVGEGKHKLLDSVVSDRNDRVDATLVIGSGKGKGGSNVVGYREGRFGYLLPGIAASHVEVFNMTERAAVGLPVPKYIKLDGRGSVVDRWGSSVSNWRRSRSAETFNNRGLSLAGLGRLDDALEDYDAAIRIRPKYPEAFRNRGVSKAKLGHVEDAIADFDTAICQDSSFSEAFFNRGVAKNSLGCFDEAIADYDEVIRLVPTDTSAYCNRGVANASLGRFLEALADLDQAIGLSPNDVKALNNRAATYSKLNRTHDAIKDFGRAIELSPRSPEIHYNMGVVLATTSETDKARRSLEMALEHAQRGGNASLVTMIVRALGRLGA